MTYSSACRSLALACILATLPGLAQEGARDVRDRRDVRDARVGRVVGVTPLVALLPGGPSTTLFAAGTLAGSRGETVTFTRASTKYCATGATTQQVNLARRSQEFDNAAWTKGGTATVTADAAVAPDGTTTADLLAGIDTITNWVYQDGVPVAASGAAYAPSFWLKKVSSTGTVECGNPQNQILYGLMRIDLSLVGSGWERITPTHAAVTVVHPFIGSASNAGGLYFAASAGGPLSFYAWGAQLEPGSSAGGYFPTTTAAAGTQLIKLLTSDQPCVESAGLLVEAAHTNIALRSQQFENATWALANNGAVAPVVTADTCIAPDGTNTADRVDFAATTAGQKSEMYQSFTASGGVYTEAFYVKGFSGSGTIYLYFFDGTFPGGVTACPYTMAWTRCSATRTPAAGGQLMMLGCDANASGGSCASPQSVCLWGGHLEPGSIAHSYVSTTTTSATSAADVVSMSGAKLPLATGRVEFDFVPLWGTAQVPVNPALLDSRDVGGKPGLLLYANGGAGLTWNLYDSSTSTAVVNVGLAWTAGQTYHLKLSWGGGKMYLLRDGTTVGSDVTGIAVMPSGHGSLGLASGSGDTPADGHLSNLKVYAK